MSAELIEKLERIAAIKSYNVGPKTQGYLQDTCASAAQAIRAAGERIEALEGVLKEISRVDVGGLQGIAEQHEFDEGDYPPAEVIARLRAWYAEEVRYLLSTVAWRREKARSALNEEG